VVSPFNCVQSKHVQHMYFPEGWRLWMGTHLIFG